MCAQRIAFLFFRVEETDVIQEELVLLGILHHELRQQIILVGGEHDLRLVHDDLEILRPGHHDRIYAGLVAAIAVEDRFSLRVRDRGVRIIELVAVIVGQVDRVVGGAIDLDFDQALRAVLRAGGNKDRSEEERGGEAVEHGGKNRKALWLRRLVKFRSTDRSVSRH